MRMCEALTAHQRAVQSLPYQQPLVETTPPCHTPNLGKQAQTSGDSTKRAEEGPTITRKTPKVSEPDPNPWESTKKDTEGPSESSDTPAYPRRSLEIAIDNIINDPAGFDLGPIEKRKRERRRHRICDDDLEPDN